MDGITLSFTDARPVLAPGALEEQVRAAAPLLAEAAAGEERYHGTPRIWRSRCGRI